MYPIILAFVLAVAICGAVIILACVVDTIEFYAQERSREWE